MAKPASFSFFFLSLSIICCSGFLVGFSFRESFIPGGAMSFLNLKQSKMSLSQIGIIRRTLGDTSTTIITVPSSANPVSASSPTNPSATPITVPSTNPPVPLAYPPPSSSPPVPLINSQPPPSTPASSATGQRWCVAKSGASQSALQSALDYACGMGAADCSQIQQGGRCYNPNTLQNHASYAFNSYYQKNPIPTSCDFGGTASLVNTNPSLGSCIYPSSSSSSSSSSTPTPSTPTTSTPSTPTPTTSTSPTPTPTPTSTSTTTPSPTSSTTTTPSSPGAFGYGSPASALNSSSGTGFTPISGLPSPPSASTTSWSHSPALRPSLGCTILLISFLTAKFTIAPRLLL